ncbi:MAG: outer membrane lipoprotein LolB [Thauera sp.]|nr:outer membrane lipoprotein LolB [Thauera sp.]
MSRPHAQSQPNARPQPFRATCRLLVSALTCAALAGCAPMGPAQATLHAQRSLAPAFELEGRMSASDGSRAASGRVEWQHDTTADRWTVFTPLGQIAAQLESDAAGARLIDGSGQLVEAPDADTLLPQVIGVAVPVARLSRWVQAAPDGEAEVRNVDPLGRPTLIIDQGWRIEYQDYASTAADAIPSRLDISRGDARIRLIIDAWTRRN